LTYIIVGASAGVGRAIACELARLGQNLVLVASSEQDLKATAVDLALRFQVDVSYIAQDLDGDLDTEEFYQKCFAGDSGDVEGILFPAGYWSEEDCGALTERELARIVNVNLKAILSICNRFVPYFQKRGKGAIVAFGSIAATRGRKKNMVYGAMKRALEAYFEALRHLFSGNKVRVQIYKLGYVDTGMNFGRKLMFPAASPEAVAKEVCRNLQKDIGAKYYPAFWKPMVFLLRLLPWAVFKKLDF